MSRRDEDGDLQDMTIDDKTVPVRVKDLESWLITAQGWELIGLERDIRNYIPQPRLVQVDLDELKAIRDSGTSMASTFSGLCALIERLEGEQA